MKVCPQCRRPAWSENDRYCYNDGEILIEGKFCKCGRQLGESEKYCPRCGEKKSA